VDEHVMEALGKAKVVIKDGKVVEVGEPMIKYCPLFHKYRGIEDITSEAIQENMQFRIQDFGMCSSKRKLRMKDFLSFGISETISTLLEEKIIDCAVIVCEGAGTVIIEDPELVQGIGGRISGIVFTTPIPEIINTIGLEKILDPKTAQIDQLAGVIKAIDNGYNNIAVTITSAEDAARLREVENKHEGVKIYIFAVHTSGISREDAELLFDQADVITGCASLHLREVAHERNCFSVGSSIPIYAVTRGGEKFMKLRIKKIGGLKEKKGAGIPEPLI
jgi:putative methanogenesis marker protein 8